MIRVIIAGSREFTDFEYAKKKLEPLFKNINKDEIEIISGNARGADKIGEEWAKFKNYKLSIFPAQWNKFGKSAGYKRNEEMANYAKESETPRLICFWNYESKGTKHMIDIAKKLNIKTKIIEF
jgi:hypothetical protein